MTASVTACVGFFGINFRKTIILLFFAQWLQENCTGLNGRNSLSWSNCVSTTMWWWSYPAITTSRGCYHKPFLGDNRFLNNLILGSFHRTTFRNCMSSSGKLISVETHGMLSFSVQYARPVHLWPLVKTPYTVLKLIIWSYRNSRSVSPQAHITLQDLLTLVMNLLMRILCNTWLQMTLATLWFLFPVLNLQK